MIRTDAKGGVAIVRLCRPEKRNAFTPDGLAKFREVVGALSLPTGTHRAILIEGEGPVFCSGFDLDACRDAPDGSVMRRFLSALSESIALLRSAGVPVVIAAQGGAIAGGCALLGGADIVVTNRDAKLGYPVVRLGVSPAVSAPFLRASVPDGAARARMLEPALIDGAEAVRIGLAHECIENADAVRPRALELAAALGEKPGFAIAATKSWLRELDAITPEIIADALGASLSLTGGDEERERLAALWSKPGS